MSSSKVAITLESGLLAEVDKLVQNHFFPSRSRAIQVAIKEKLDRLNQTMLSQQCAKLSPDYEQSLAEEGLNEDLSQWPEY